MEPTEIPTAVQQGLKVTVVVSENHGYQVIHRLQIIVGARPSATSSATAPAPAEASPSTMTKARLDGDYLKVDLRQIA